MIKKPDVLSDEEFDKWCEKRCYYKNGICYVANSCNACRYTAQLDVCVKHYEPLIKEMYEELLIADEVICNLCKRLNPQHEDCVNCGVRDQRLQVLAEVEGK